VQTLTYDSTPTVSGKGGKKQPETERGAPTPVSHVTIRLDTKQLGDDKGQKGKARTSRIKEQRGVLVFCVAEMRTGSLWKKMQSSPNKTKKPVRENRPKRGKKSFRRTVRKEGTPYDRTKSVGQCWQLFD